MQCAVIEFGRNVLGLKNAHSTEMDENTEDAVISMMEEQKKVTLKGGTMRLGSYVCELKKGTKAHHIYGKSKITERHRHRYEFNNKFLEAYEKAGMIASGFNPDNNLVEIVELKNHPYFVAAQFHPELKSTVANPHPLFVKFVAASIEHSKKKV
jgi:CTP synthase